MVAKQPCLATIMQVCDIFYRFLATSYSEEKDNHSQTRHFGAKGHHSLAGTPQTFVTKPKITW